MKKNKQIYANINSAIIAREPNSMITLSQSSRTYLSVPNQVGTVPRWQPHLTLILEQNQAGAPDHGTSALPAHARTTPTEQLASSFVRDTSVPGPGRAVQRGCVQNSKPAETSSSPEIRLLPSAPAQKSLSPSGPATTSRERDRTACRAAARPAGPSQARHARRLVAPGAGLPGRRSAAPSAFERVRIWAASRGHVRARVRSPGSASRCSCRPAASAPVPSLPG